MSTDGKSKRKVLIAMDGSDHSEFAFKWYLDNLALDIDEVLLVYCAEYSITFPPMIPLAASNAADMRNQMEAQNQKFQHFLDRLELMAKETKICGSVVRAQGRPGEAIVTVAKERGVDIILTGSRGLGAIRRTVLGSVSDYVLHHSHIPVIICKRPD